VVIMHFSFFCRFVCQSVSRLLLQYICHTDADRGHMGHRNLQSTPGHPSRPTQYVPLLHGRFNTKEWQLQMLIPKKAKEAKLYDYRPVALTSVIMNCFERLVKDHITSTHSNLLTAPIGPQTISKMA
jgi:hypothetical protein